MRKYFVSILILAGITAPTFAQTSLREKTDLFKVEIGPVIPIAGDLEDVANTGFLLGGQWIHRISPDLGLGAEISFISFDDKSQGNVETKVDMMTLMGLSCFALNSSSSKEPYLLAGLGITQTDLDVNTNSGLISSDDDTSPSVLIGGGALQLLGQLRW